MMLQKTCKWIVTNVITPTIVGIASTMLAAMVMAHFHLA